DVADELLLVRRGLAAGAAEEAGLGHVLRRRQQLLQGGEQWELFFDRGLSRALHARLVGEVDAFVGRGLRGGGGRLLVLGGLERGGGGGLLRLPRRDLRRVLLQGAGVGGEHVL